MADLSPKSVVDLEPSSLKRPSQAGGIFRAVDSNSLVRDCIPGP